MLDILTPILDLIAPPSDSVRLIRPYQPTDMTRFFSPERVGATVAIAPFHSPVVHAAVIANKFNDYPKAATLLAHLLEEWLDTLPKKSTCLVPIPLSSERQQERGYNQVERIITAVAREHVSYRPLLTRVKDTAPQTTLTRRERLRNMVDAFAIATDKVPDYERIIIVDDVITTGATLTAATLALSPHLPPDCELMTVAIAH